MVAVGVVEDLPYGPPVAALVEYQHRRATRVGPGAELIVFFEVVRHRLLPGLGVPAVTVIEGPEFVVMPQSRELNATEHRVPDQHPKRLGVGGYAAGGRRGDLPAHFVGRVRQVLPLIKQARVDLADQFPEPLDQVAKLLVLGLVGNRLLQRLVRVGQVAQYDAFRSG